MRTNIFHILHAAVFRHKNVKLLFTELTNSVTSVLNMCQIFSPLIPLRNKIFYP